MRRGLTYVELLVTFAIVAVMATVAGVGYLRATGPSTVLRASARELTSDLRLAAQRATATQINHAVRFELTPTHRYRLVRLSNPELELKTVSLPPEITFSFITLPQNTATFNVLGAAVASGTVTLQHAQGQTMTIEIGPSGYVRSH